MCKIFSFLWLAVIFSSLSSDRVYADRVLTDTLEGHILTIHTRNLKSDTGKVRFVLFSKATSRSWSGNFFQATELPVNNKRCTWNTPPIPFGIYAVAMFHDMNNNGELDKKAIGIPLEPYGFSNDAHGPIGPPSIDQAWFVFDKRHHVISIKLR